MMTKKRKIILAVALVLLIVAVILYWRNGGFATPDVELVDQKPRIVNGKRYTGIDTKLGDVIDTLRQRNEAISDPKDFIIFSYREPSEDHTIDVFAGVLVDDSSSSIHPDYKFTVIPARKIVRGHINAHESMINKVQNSVFDFIEENNLTITNKGMTHWVKYSTSTIKDNYFDVPVVEE